MKPVTTIAAIALIVAAGPTVAGDLCKANSFARSQAVLGQVEFDSSCGLCHQYNLKGRVPDNARNETPDIRILNSKYTKTIDDNGGVVPSLLSEQFLAKWKDQEAFQIRISTAISGFPPKDYAKGASDLQIAAYILYQNCGGLKGSASGKSS